MVLCVVGVFQIIFAVALAVFMLLFALLHLCDDAGCDEIAVDAVIVYVLLLIFVFMLAVELFMHCFLS